MIELFTDPATLSLISLGDFWFYVAILLSIVISALLSSSYSTDPLFRSMHFWLSISMCLVVLIVNVLLTQRASMGIFRPMLIGRDIFDAITAASPNLSHELRDGVGLLLQRELPSHSWPAVGWAFIIFLIGMASAMNPPPKWEKSNGIDVLNANIPNIIDYSIRSILLSSLFISAMLILITVVLFDLTQLANLERSQGILGEPPAYFKDRSFDAHFFIVIALAPFFFVKAIGKVWQIRYRMIHGGLEGYRPNKLRVLAALYRRKERLKRPVMGNKT